MKPLLLVGLHAGQFAFLLWLAYTGDFCCDAYYYMGAGDRLLRQGLIYQDDFAGYRSYFVPLVLGLLNQLPVPAMPGSRQALPLTLSVAFTLVSFATSRYILRRESVGRYLVFALPAFCNPFLLGHVGVPLQESILMLMVVPLIVVLLTVRERSPYATLGLAVLAASLAFIIRGSMAWIAAPLALFVVLDAWRDSAPWRAASKTALAALAVWIPLFLVAPQSYVMFMKFATLEPYPQHKVLTRQIFHGIQFIKMTTMLHEGQWKQLRAVSPYTSLPLEKKTLSFYRENVGPAVFLVGAHIWAGLHYDVLTTYVKFEQLHIVSPWLVLSGFIVAYGLLGLVRICRDPPERSQGALLATMFLLSCLYTAFIGVEARFGLMGFLAVSVGAAYLAASREGRNLMRVSFPLSAAYVLLCVIFNAMLLYAAPEI